MTEKYDVVIIGSGIGGMCAAARLAHSGYKTLVVEKLPLLGGRFATMEYRGFTLSTGAEAIECGGVLESTFQEVGADFPVRRPPADIRYRIKGVDYDVPMGGGGLRRLMAMTTQDEAEVAKVMGAIKRSLSWQEPSFSISLRDWIAQYSTDENILGILQTFCAAIFAVNADEAPAPAFIRFIKAMGGRIAHGFAPNGNSTLVEALARSVRERGGEAWTRATVRAIRVENRQAHGVLVERGGDDIEIEARIVVSNAGPHQTVELAGKEHFDGGYLMGVRRMRPAPSVVLYIGSDRPLMDHPGVFMPVHTRRACFVVAPTLTCPELAPKGKHLLVSFGAFGKSFGPIDLRKELELNVMDLKELLPAFSTRGKVLLAGCFHGGWPAFRSWPGDELPQKTPVENFYNVGDGVKVTGWVGLEASAEAARIVVEDIRTRFTPSNASVNRP